MNLKKLGNSRLLFCEQGQDQVDLNRASALVDFFVSRSRQVELVHEKIFVYPRDGKIWAGKEIAGYPTQLPEEVFMRDFKAFDVYETQMPNPFETFADLLKEAVAIGEREGREIHRLVFDLDHFDAPIIQFGATST